MTFANQMFVVGWMPFYVGGFLVLLCVVDRFSSHPTTDRPLLLIGLGIFLSGLSLIAAGQIL